LELKIAAIGIAAVPAMAWLEALVAQLYCAVSRHLAAAVPT